MRGFIFGEGTENPTLEDLVRQREAHDIRRRPTGFPSNVGEGLTYLGQAIGRRRDMGRMSRLNEQIRELDPTGEIVRALMRGQR